MARETRIVIDSLEAFLERGVKQLVTECHANLVRAPSEGGTPVDTGHARANWVPSITTPSTEIAGSAGNVNQGPSQSGLAQVISAYALSNGPAFISNNVPYIQVLNEGSSDQAPAAFVQSAIGEAVSTVSRTLR